MKFSTILLAIFSITLIAGCRTVAVIPVAPHATVVHTTHSVHPHAPTHGHRHHHHDHDLVYDSDFGAYLVLGYDGIYFHNNLYFRFYSGAWQSSLYLNHSWRHADHQHIPYRLRNHKHYRKHRRHGPPPHAPAHGYRHHHYQHGVDLIFDSGVGAYIVLGFDNLYFYNNNYMRFDNNRWQYSDRYNGKWRRAEDRRVPLTLRKARKKHKKALIKRHRKQYANEHEESREYRKRQKAYKSKGKHNGGSYKKTRKHADDEQQGKKKSKDRGKNKNYRERDNHDNGDRRNGKWRRHSDGRY